MENPLTDDVMISIKKQHMQLVCRTLILGISSKADEWDTSSIGAGHNNRNTCSDLHALTGLLCQVHNKITSNWMDRHTR